MAFSDYQFDIYRAGLRGVLPTLPTDAKGLETRAVQALAPAIVSYVQGGSGDELTQSRNIEGFGAWGIVPRMLVDASNRELGVDLFGVRLPSPVFMSPVGVAGSAHPMATGIWPLRGRPGTPALPSLVRR